MKRRTALGVSVAAILMTATLSSGSQAADVKIGLAIPTSGIFTALGKELERGFTIHMEDVKWRAGAHKISVIQEDTQGKPNIGLTKVQKLVELNKVNLMTGILSSSVGLAVKSYIHRNKVPLVMMISSVDEITAKNPSPYINRIIESNVQQVFPYGEWVAGKRGFKRAVVIGSDYAAGRSQARAFMAGFKSAGGTVVQEIYPPLGTADYAPFLSRIDASKADMVFAFTPGSDQLRLFKQFQEYGLKGKLQMIGGSGQPDFLTLRAAGKTALGTIVVDFYSRDVDTPENKHYLALYKKKYGKLPTEWAYLGYAAAMVITNGLRASGNDVSRESLRKALRNVSFNGPKGPIKFDENGQMIGSIFFSEVVEKGGQVTKKMIDRRSNIRILDYYKRLSGK